MQPAMRRIAGLKDFVTLVQTARCWRSVKRIPEKVANRDSQQCAVEDGVLARTHNSKIEEKTPPLKKKAKLKEQAALDKKKFMKLKAVLKKMKAREKKAILEEQVALKEKKRKKPLKHKAR